MSQPAQVDLEAAFGHHVSAMLRNTTQIFQGAKTAGESSVKNCEQQIGSPWSELPLSVHLYGCTGASTL